MNNESTNSFSALTAANIIALAASDNLDDNELAHRLGNRLVLELSRELSTITAGEAEHLAGLVEVTDRDLARIASLNGEAA
jgi:hypothetical protein